MVNSIVISSGHAKYVSGASDIIDEVTEARKVVNQVAAYLKQLGVTVYAFHDDTSRTQDDNLRTIVNYHNSKNRDLDVSVHFNSAARTNNPLGVEAYYYDSAQVAAAVSQAIATAGGLKNRGAKQNKSLRFLNSTNKPAILIEVSFVNSTADVDLYRKNFDAICRAIAETLAGKKLSQPKPQAAVQNNKPSIVYEAHVQNSGWQAKKRDGQTAGSIGQSLRLEALTVKLENSNAKLEMQGHIEDLGWTSLRTNGEVIGTIGEGLRLEAIKIKADGLNILYRVHVQNIGWTNWAKNGEVAGTRGKELRIEAIEIKIG